MSTFKERYPRTHKVLRYILDLAIDQWFLIGLAIFIVISRFAPNFARQGGLIRGEYTIGYGAVAVIFLGSGLSMDTRSLLANMGHWRAHLTVLVLQFLISSSIMYGFCCAIMRAKNDKISEWMLVGVIVTACCPTTVSSNVVMTRKADGNELLTLCEVFIGNILGGFITPALVQMYTTGEWAFSNPANGSSVTRVYRDVMQQVGCCVFVPIVVGQAIQNLFPKQTKWFLTTFKFNKVGSFMLLLIMFSSFSTAFYQHAFTDVSSVSIIMIVFFNIGIYLLFTVICYLISRPLFLLKIFEQPPDESSSRFYKITYFIFRPFYYNRRDTVSVMLCGGAKTAALGVALITDQYGSDNPHLGQLLVPLVLYQAEQVVTAGFLTKLMKNWIHADPEVRAEDEAKRLKKANDDLEKNNTLQEQEDEEPISEESQGDDKVSNSSNLVIDQFRTDDNDTPLTLTKSKHQI